MDGMLIWTIIGVAFTTLGLAAGGLWTYNESVKAQFKDMDNKFTEGFKTMFRRMDENKDSYWKNFVSKEVHDLQMKNITEKVEDHYEALVEKIDDLTVLIKEKNGG